MLKKKRKKRGGDAKEGVGGGGSTITLHLNPRPYIQRNGTPRPKEQAKHRSGRNVNKNSGTKWG